MEATLASKAIIDGIINKVKAQGTVIKIANKIAEIPVKKTGNKFSLSIADYGTFDFTGSIDPLELESEVIPIEDLEKFPGYKIYKHMALQEIMFHISPDGLMMKPKPVPKTN